MNLMRKRSVLLFLTLCLLAASVFGVQAAGMSKDDTYEAAQRELLSYFRYTNSMPLEQMNSHFTSLGSYQMSTAFSLYTSVLMDVEAENYDDVFLMLYILAQNKEFGAHLEAVGFPSVAELESYAKGREAELKGEITEAVSNYEQCLTMLDSMVRYMTLQSNSAEHLYQQALKWLREMQPDSAAKAYTVFAQLAEFRYKDSETRMAQAYALMPTPTPEPTVTQRPTPPPTPAPTPYPYDASKTHVVSGDSMGRKYKLYLSLDKAGKIDVINVYAPSLHEGHGKLCGGDHNNRFPRQFFGKTGPFEVGVNIDAVSGATTTSRDIVQLINETIEKIKSGELY